MKWKASHGVQAIRTFAFVKPKMEGVYRIASIY